MSARLEKVIEGLVETNIAPESDARMLNGVLKVLSSTVLHSLFEMDNSFRVKSMCQGDYVLK